MTSDRGSAVTVTVQIGDEPVEQRDIRVIGVLRDETGTVVGAAARWAYEAAGVLPAGSTVTISLTITSPDAVPESFEAHVYYAPGWGDGRAAASSKKYRYWVQPVGGLILNEYRNPTGGWLMGIILGKEADSFEAASEKAGIEVVAPLRLPDCYELRSVKVVPDLRFVLIAFAEWHCLGDVAPGTSPAILRLSYGYALPAALRSLEGPWPAETELFTGAPQDPIVPEMWMTTAGAPAVLLESIPGADLRTGAVGVAGQMALTEEELADIALSLAEAYQARE